MRRRAPNGPNARCAPVQSMKPFLVLALFAAVAACGAPWVSEQANAGDFPLASAGRAATLVTSPEDAKVVGIAARDLAADVERVTGIKPTVAAAVPAVAGPTVLIGTLGQSALIDG